MNVGIYVTRVAIYVFGSDFMILGKLLKSFGLNFLSSPKCCDDI